MDDFFDEEVIRPLDPLLAQFLIDISALGVLTADVCDAAREAEDSAALLDDALRSGLFIEAIDGYRREYRLHLLFAQYLQCALMRQGRGRHHAIVLRGAVWFERQGRWLAAFDCLARADAWDMAAKLLDRHGLRACLSGHGPQVTAMALRLPHDILLLHPRVAILAARGANTGWQFGLVEDFLQLAYTTTSKDRPDEVETLALHSRMLMAQYEDNQCEAGRKCLMLLERAGTLDHYTRGTIFGSLLYARREQFDFTDAAELEATGIREFNLSERSVGMVWHLSVAGPTHAMRGDLATGARRLEEAADAAARLPDANGMASVPGLLLAELCYERNEIAQSRALIDKHHPAPLVGFIDQYVAGYVTGARLLRLAGDVEAAHRRLDEGMALAEARTLERLRQSMVGERIRLLLASGEPQRALDIGKRENLLGEPDALGPATGATTRDDMRAASWFRLALLRGEHEAAIGLGKLWKRFALKAGAITPAMRWEILLAQAYAALAQPARSQRELRNALGRAVTGGHVRSFIDEGTPVRRLLQDQLEASTIQTSPTDALVVSLLDAFAAEAIADADALSVLQASESGQTTSFTPLTRTQIEILQMASAGLQNREIARRIGMTEGSVKWYMQQIFNKIGVRKRAGALERARSLGLLA